MLITKVQFDNMRFLPDRDRHQAVVILTTDECTMCLRANAEVAPAANRDAVGDALVSDAMRQVRRMPEFRTGARQVNVCSTAPYEYRSFADAVPAVQIAAE